MDCNTARMLAELRGNRVNELPPEDAAALDGHLHSCPDCHSLIQNEEKLDAPLLKAMAAVPLPPGLKAKIFDRLATERGAILRRRLWGMTAAVAAVIVAVGVFTWNPDRKPKIDLHELVKHADRYAEDPRAASENWLVSQGVQHELPEPFNSNLLAFHGTVVIQGKQVPMLCYSAYEDGKLVSAKVYVLRAADFDFSALPKVPEGGSWGERGHQVKVYQRSEQLVYVVIYNSRDLTPFMKQSPVA